MCINREFLVTLIVDVPLTAKQMVPPKVLLLAHFEARFALARIE